MKLEYKDLVIRSAQIEDAHQLMLWWNNGKIMNHCGFPYGLKTNLDKIHQEINNNNESKQRLILEYQYKKIGEMSYSQIDENTVEIGIKICEFDYQEKGLGRIYLSMLIHELFNRYSKIILDTDLENKRAQHVYELLGFEKKKINVHSWNNQVGELRSSVDYELTFENFKTYLKDY